MTTSFVLTVTSVIGLYGITSTVAVRVNGPTVAVIVAVPSLIAVTLPFLSTVAIVSSLDDHAMVLLSVVLDGVNVVLIVCVNDWLIVYSVLFSLKSVNGNNVLTVIVAVLPFFVVAVIVAVPLPIAVINPFASTVAIVLLLVFHVIVLSSFVLAGLKITSA